MLDDNLNMDSSIIMIAKNVFLFLRKKIFNFILWLCPYGLFLFFTKKQQLRNELLRLLHTNMYSRGLIDGIEYFMLTNAGKKLLESLGYSEIIKFHNKDNKCFNSLEINRLKTDINNGFYDEKLKEIINSIKSI